ncbi:MAG: M48 family metallopeptidase [Candidatus Omnitrophica bacterium]|nr:M48 family metallopeptidase [Candidatus Omnitrophota bacterium]
MSDVRIDAIIRSKRKTLALHVQSDATVVVRAPMRIPLDTIASFVQEKLPWIRAKQELARKRVSSRAKISWEQYPDSVRRQLVIWYTQMAQDILSDRVRFYADKLGVVVRHLAVTNARTRWGSCGPSGTLNFSWRLVMAPLPVIDYVVMHELVHLFERNHSRRFWRRVADAMPEYKEYETWLKMNGHMLCL